ncbi:MAG: O-acetylhomoserine aminocarboxypropyltransferase/cysteine synthase [Selenomonadaceae bacterium]|nr:O-acetylhomoserine aminocarboxypropyltransferase/cysteine synthase [Selenomonadaceae bacterium]
MTEKTKLVYTETIGNPKLDVADIKVLSDLAHNNNLPLFVDNTVTTPFMIRPLELGADVVIHSASKALNGNGNSIGGIVIVGNSAVWNLDKFPKLREFEKFGPLMYLARLRARMAADFGSALSPFNAHLTSIGLDTLALRMERATDNALALAEYLSYNKKVKISYPGLLSHPDYELAKRQFQGRYGLMFTLKAGSMENAFKFIDGLKLALNVSNIGDARTLVIHPWSTIFLHADDEEKAASGITEDLVRVAVGIEDIEDLKEDFEQSLAKL